MKWVSNGGVYTFTITESYGNTFDLHVEHYGGRDFFWFRSLNAAKQFVRREYAGCAIERWKKVSPQ
jgi:hypothetical protein